MLFPPTRSHDAGEGLMRLNRFGAAMLAVCLILALFPAAGSAGAEEGSRPTLIVYFMPANGETGDLPLVNQRVNEYLRARFDYDVQLVLPRQNNYHQTIQGELALGRQIDVAFCNNAGYLEQWVESGWLHPLNALLQREGAGIRQWIAEPYMYRVNGVIYGAGNNVERGRSYGFEYSLDLAEQYGIDLQNVRTADDLTAVFAQVAQKCPGVVPTVVHPGYYLPVDPLGSGLYGVLMKPEDTQVQNLFESDWFRHQLALTYAWAQAGYTYDRLSDSNYLLYYMSSEKIFGALCEGKPGFAAQESYLTGQRIGYIELSPYTLYSSAVNRPYCYVIPRTSADPQAAMRLLNLLYTDSTLANLLIYGIEGTHYQKTTPYSVRRNPDSRYGGINGYTYCNQYTAYTFDGAPETIWQDMIRADLTAPRSAGYGFLFDPSAVNAQIVQCDIVYGQYIDFLFSGQADPEEILDEFLEALSKAGIRDIIEEKQRQFDLFLGKGDAP